MMDAFWKFAEICFAHVSECLSIVEDSQVHLRPVGSDLENFKPFQSSINSIFIDLTCDFYESL
jgi:hypothetical protein